MEYWHLRLLNNRWIAPLLKTHYSIIPPFQSSDPVFLLYRSILWQMSLSSM
jgi:hypothetical protein